MFCSFIRSMLTLDSVRIWTSTFQVGTHLMAATLNQLGFPVEIVYGNLDWLLASVQLKKAVAVAFAHRFLQKAKIGLVGYHAPGFQDLHPDPFCMRKTFGAILLHIGLAEYEAVPIEEKALKAAEDDVKVIMSASIDDFKL